MCYNLCDVIKPVLYKQASLLWTLRYHLAKTTFNVALNLDLIGGHNIVNHVLNQIRLMRAVLFTLKA